MKIMGTRILKHLGGLISICLLLISCNTISNLKTATEYDEKAEFGVFEDYKFMTEVSISDTRDNHSTENKRTFENAIHQELSRKGLQETESPDLFVNFFVVDEQKSESITQTSYRDQQYGGMTHLDTYIKNYEQGTLIIDLVSVKTKQLVWRGIGTGVITGKQKDMEKTISEAVKAVLSEYPPKA